jgi:hypothetical protein
MSVSKKDREAYERGQKEREAQSNPLTYLITPSEHEGDTASEKAAFKKGLRDEQLDGDKGGSSGCFITTACVEYAGLSDDCYELQMMRKFRDEFISSLPEATSLLNDYYRTAPSIVQSIKLQKDSKDIFEKLLSITRKVVTLIHAGHNSQALVLCKREFKKLRKKYCTE